MIRAILKVLKYVAITVGCLLLLVVSSALLYRKYLQHQVAEDRAITSPPGINTLERVRIGGIDQWIQVRGRSMNSPILLFIHGGPGVPFIPLARAFQGPWEKWFTVVQWDQRGAGKTYASNGVEVQRDTMKIPQMEQDTVEVVNYLRNRFHRDKIFVLGHSWGSVLGLWLAHEHPELIYAYVGTGQVVNMRQNDLTAYRDALEQARSQRREAAIRGLEGIAPYPDGDTDLEKAGIARAWEEELLGPPVRGTPFVDVRRILLDLVSTPEYSLMDDYGFIRGQALSLNVFVPQMAQVKLDELGRDFHAPVFFFEGRHDPYCRPALIWDYSRTIEAPQKRFIWFENSGHFPFFEEQQKFREALVDQVLPLAHSGTGGG